MRPGQRTQGKRPMTEAAAEVSEQEVAISPVGIIESPYREKFSVPRQSGLASNVS